MPPVLLLAFLIARPTGLGAVRDGVPGAKPATGLPIAANQGTWVKFHLMLRVPGDWCRLAVPATVQRQRQLLTSILPHQGKAHPMIQGAKLAMVCCPQVPGRQTGCTGNPSTTSPWAE